MTIRSKGIKQFTPRRYENLEDSSIRLCFLYVYSLIFFSFHRFQRKSIISFCQSFCIRERGGMLRPCPINPLPP